MWTPENRARYNRDKLRYPSDMTDEEWALIEPLIPPARRGGRRREVNVREVVNGIMLLSTLFGLFPFLKKLFADGAYAGPVFHDALAKVLPHLQIEIVKRPDTAKGFVVLRMANTWRGDRVVFPYPLYCPSQRMHCRSSAYR